MQNRHSTDNLHIGLGYSNCDIKDIKRHASFGISLYNSETNDIHACMCSAQYICNIFPFSIDPCVWLFIPMGLRRLK